MPHASFMRMFSGTSADEKNKKTSGGFIRSKVHNMLV